MSWFESIESKTSKINYDVMICKCVYFIMCFRKRKKYNEKSGFEKGFNSENTVCPLISRIKRKLLKYFGLLVTAVKHPKIH